MFGWGEASDAYSQVNEGKHEGHLSHEVIAGAAAFEGFKAFENHQRKSGKEVSHEKAKEILIGLAAAEADKLIETKGLDYVDSEKAKHQAKKQAESLYDDHYGSQDSYNPDGEPPHHLKRFF